MTPLPRPLPARAHELFEAKGPENAARVRRLVQLVSAIHDRPRDWRGLRVLDLGCGEGLFSIEAAAHGAQVLAIDGRDQRMAHGRALAEELALDNLRFVRADVRHFPFEEQGAFDVVLALGLLYHLDVPDLFDVVHRIGRATLRTLLVETHVAPHADVTVEHGGRTYRGWRYREHRPEDDAQVRAARLLASLDSPTSFWPTADSLDALLEDAGFPTVLACRLPAQPSEADDRVALAALKGGRPPTVSFPWIDDASGEEVRRRGRTPARALPMPPFDTATERAHAAVVRTLVAWTDRHRDFVPGLRTLPGIWRRADLESYTGGLRRVPPLLAVLLDPEDLDSATDLLEVGTATVWRVFPEDAQVEVRTADGARSHAPAERLPEPLGLSGLAPRAADLLGLSDHARS